MPEYENGFEIYYWMGTKRYKCNQKWSTGAPCQFDSQDFDTVLEHSAQSHSETPKRRVPRPTTVSPILGPDGQPVVRDVSEARFKEED
jgi:hypothetical protein